jgi:hypothetical protein
VVQKGLANTQSALDWIKQEMNVGNIASTLTELVVMGCSAGSLGAQFWGKQVATQLKWKKAAVIPDSYAGVFPEGSMGPLMYSFGFCNSGFLSETLYKKCMQQQLEVTDIDLEAIQTMPTLPFAFIQSKSDIVQRSFYDAIALTVNSTKKVIGAAEFYQGVNTIFGSYNQNPNFVTYLVNGDHHCFTNQNLYYDADATGPNGSKYLLRSRSTSDKKLHEWTSLLPLDEAKAIDTQCDGDIQSINPRDLTYCDAKVVPKHYEQHY